MLRRTALALVVIALAPAALAAETKRNETKRKPTVAILFFDYGGKDTALEPLREGLAQMLIADIAAPEIQVVERARLKALLAEQKLGQSSKVDPSSAARVGRLLGASHLVLGSYFDLGPSLRIDARVVEVETGKIVRAVGASGPSADFWSIEQDLADKLGAVLATALPEQASRPRPSNAKRPKVDSGTIATYGKALLALDSGKKDEAKSFLTKVVDVAPTFALAKAELNALLQ